MIKKILIGIFCLFTTLCLLLFGGLYFGQEHLIFHPTKLPADYHFNYKNKFEEMSITAKDGNKLNGLLFKSDSAKGLVFYLHGNGGALDTWGNISHIYTDLHYDIFILDYRGYGKSEGKITSEKQFYSDIQTVYDSLKQLYAESNTVIIGYSIGTGPAAILASVNHPKLLILLTPYYSLTDMAEQQYPFSPGFILKYKFETCKGVSKTKAPVIIFHGNADEVINYHQSLKLKQCFKTGDRLFILPNQGHGGMNENEIYQQELKQLL